MRCTKYNQDVSERTCLVRQKKLRESGYYEQLYFQCRVCLFGKKLYNKEKGVRVIEEKIKKCPMCKKEKTTTSKFFNFSQTSKDRLTIKCSDCLGKIKTQKLLKPVVKKTTDFFTKRACPTTGWICPVCGCGISPQIYVCSCKAPQFVITSGPNLDIPQEKGASCKI